MLNQELIDYTIEMNCTLFKNLKKEIYEEVKREKMFVVPEDIYDYGVSYHISYDGGNHPEYASTMFSAIETIEYDSDEDKVIIITEDGEMQLEWLDTNDLVTIAQLILFCKSMH